jgi:hypothetical protein
MEILSLDIAIVLLEVIFRSMFLEEIVGSGALNVARNKI